MKRGKGLKRTRKPVDQESLNKMRDFFLFIWSKRRHYSEISNTYLGSEPLTVFFHHIILKTDAYMKEYYPEAMYDEDNVIILTFDEHTNVHNDMYRYPEINKRREMLAVKYNLV